VQSSQSFVKSQIQAVEARGLADTAGVSLTQRRPRALTGLSLQRRGSLPSPCTTTGHLVAASPRTMYTDSPRVRDFVGVGFGKRYAAPPGTGPRGRMTCVCVCVCVCVASAGGQVRHRGYDTPSVRWRMVRLCQPCSWRQIFTGSLHRTTHTIANSCCVYVAVGGERRHDAAWSPSLPGGVCGVSFRGGNANERIIAAAVFTDVDARRRLAGAGVRCATDCFHRRCGKPHLFYLWLLSVSQLANCVRRECVAFCAVSLVTQLSPTQQRRGCLASHPVRRPYGIQPGLLPPHTLGWHLA
jgi:hypothetical protein